MSHKSIAIIPARGGSKRIPKKNIKDFLGKPIIAYSIETAIKSKLFDEVMVSTDDMQVAEISKLLGAKIPFMRSKENSNDYAGTADVLVEVLKEYKNRNINFDYCCCIYPTAPFITPEKLKESFELFKVKDYDSLFPVVKYSYPIQRSYKFLNDKISMVWPENYSKRSQDLEQIYHDAGQFYWLKLEEFIKKKQIYNDNTGTIILSELEVQDIDSEEDWKLAEMKFKLLKESEKA